MVPSTSDWSFHNFPRTYLNSGSLISCVVPYHHRMAASLVRRMQNANLVSAFALGSRASPSVESWGISQDNGRSPFLCRRKTLCLADLITVLPFCSTSGDLKSDRWPPVADRFCRSRWIRYVSFESTIPECRWPSSATSIEHRQLLHAGCSLLGHFPRDVQPYICGLLRFEAGSYIETGFLAS